MVSVSAIILATGESTRLGISNKLLLPFRQSTIIAHVTKEVCAANVSEVIAVVGHQANPVMKELNDTSARFVLNHQYKQGMTSSIQAGVRASSPTASGYMILPGDMAFIESAELDQLANSFKANLFKNNRVIVAPVYQGIRGNPVIFAAHYRHQILTNKETRGCKAIIDRHKKHLIELEMKDDHVLIDIDSEEDYQKYCG